MKKILKIFLFVIVCSAVITLTQSATFVGVWGFEKTFLTGFWTAPSEWLGTVVLWKYVAVGLSVLGVIVTAIVSLVKKCLKKRKSRQRKQRLEVRVTEPRKATVTEPRKAKATDGAVVISSTAKTSNPTKFTRVPPKD